MSMPKIAGICPRAIDFTIGLITNPEALTVNQSSANGRQSYRKGGIIAWTADRPGSHDKYLAVFNESDGELPVDLPWSSVGIQTAPAKVHDLWTHKDWAATATLHISLAPHASVFYEAISK